MVMTMDNILNETQVIEVIWDKMGLIIGSLKQQTVYIFVSVR